MSRRRDRTVEPAEGLAMRLPRMTTRRWMGIVAALAIALGGSIEAARLKKKRDVFLARAVWHGAAEQHYRDLVQLSETGTLSGKYADRVPRSDAESIAGFDGMSDPYHAPTDWDPDRSEREDRFREAQARVTALAVRRRTIVINHLRSQVKYHRDRASYHAALRRKYEAAAARPWLGVTPEPPMPQ